MALRAVLATQRATRMRPPTPMSAIRPRGGAHTTRWTARYGERTAASAVPAHGVRGDRQGSYWPSALKGSNSESISQERKTKTSFLAVICFPRNC